MKSENWHFHSRRLKKEQIRKTFDDPKMPKSKPKMPTKIPSGNGKFRKVKNCFVDKKQFFQFFEENDEQIGKLLEFYGINANPELFFR